MAHISVYSELIIYYFFYYDFMKKQKIRYVDGFVIAIPKKNLKAYKTVAAAAGRVWKKHGALDYKECVGDDLGMNMGLPFTKLAKIKPGETVLFSYIGYASRAHRDRVNAKVMKDPFMKQDPYKDKPMPFDMKRMAYGGFAVMVDI